MSTEQTNTGATKAAGNGSCGEGETVGLGVPVYRGGLDQVPPLGDGEVLSKKDFTSGSEVRWCPGCGDYAILAAVQGLMPELGVKRENFVVVSGIGCASRFPYYLDIFGMHSIHGRAPAIATGLATSRPDLTVWVATGDGDALAIGGNHLIHAMRRNVNITILLFNNRIYGLTKGQYSPTSEIGKVTKSTPVGSVDAPFNPISLALGAEATFVARTMDSDRKHLQSVLTAAVNHRGAALVEIYQNCPIFNNGAYDVLKDKDQREARVVNLEHDRPITWGSGAERKSLVRRPHSGLEVVSEAERDGRHLAHRPRRHGARSDGHFPPGPATHLRRRRARADCPRARGPGPAAGRRGVAGAADR